MNTVFKKNNPYYVEAMKNAESFRYASLAEKTATGKRQSDFTNTYAEKSKSGKISGASTSGIYKIDYDELEPLIYAKVNKIITEATNKAEEITRKAYLDASVIKEKAFQSGYEAGYEEGQKAAGQEIQKKSESISRAFKNGLDNIASIKTNILEESENGIIQLTIAIAKKLACRELKQHPDTIIHIIKDTIKALRNREDIIIRVNPDDHTTLEQHLDELLQSIGKREESKSPIRIEVDPNLTPGGCVIETDKNVIDVSFESRLESIFSMLDT